MRAAAVLTLALMRIGIGALAWARPAWCARLFGLPAPTPESSYLWRLFGVRDVVVGTATLRAAAEQRNDVVAFGLLCDAADGTAAALARRGDTATAGADPMVLVPAAAVGVGIWLLRGPRS